MALKAGGARRDRLAFGSSDRYFKVYFGGGQGR
jgi:hypothetical protein